MTKLIQEHLSYGFISFRVLMLFVLTASLIGCSITPEMVRKQAANRETQVISAKRPLVASCIAQQLKQETKSTSSYKVIESEESIVLMQTGVTVRLYDLEDSIGGTMVTFYCGSPFHRKECLSVIDHCREQFESPKAPPQSQTK
jgi:hypothetical protein